MLRRRLLTGAASVFAAPMLNFGKCRLFGAAGGVYPTRVVDLVSRTLVIDMLGLLTMDWAKLDRWHERPSEFSATDFNQVRSSGVDALHPAVDLNADNPHETTLEWLRRWKTFISEHPHEFIAVHRAGDLEPVKKAGRIAIIMGMQNSEHFRSAEDVRLFHNEGQRISQLTYSRGNRLGSGCADRYDNGLSHFGCDVIRAMNECGMVIDVSHGSERSTLGAIEASRKPVLITHSNCRALVRHPRCKSDEVIKAMARKGGVMGITGVRTFLSPRRRATIEDFLDHFDYAAKLVGVEHLGIGSDAGMDATNPAPHLDVQGLHHPGRVFDLAAGLLRRGYSEEAVGGILGGNFQRALDSILPAA